MFRTDKLNCDLSQVTRRRTKVRREVKFVRSKRRKKEENTH